MENIQQLKTAARSPHAKNGVHQFPPVTYHATVVHAAGGVRVADLWAGAIRVSGALLQCMGVSTSDREPDMHQVIYGLLPSAVLA